eukprot:COSAG01_NODE_28249_length_665_cov_4.542403_1_plen_76_part_10
MILHRNFLPYNRYSPTVDTHTAQYYGAHGLSRMQKRHMWKSLLLKSADRMERLTKTQNPLKTATPPKNNLAKYKTK